MIPDGVLAAGRAISEPFRARHPDRLDSAADPPPRLLSVAKEGGQAFVGREPETEALLAGLGVRSGADVVKALALGATAVGVGRPYAWGLALGGEDGVVHVLRTILAEVVASPPRWTSLAGICAPADGQGST
jgi:isopentenyl diphosphate isomerase/L-lactate dehydrogenase-like FMN-dependent dehydrogenase